MPQGLLWYAGRSFLWAVWSRPFRIKLIKHVCQIVGYISQLSSAFRSPIFSYHALNKQPILSHCPGDKNCLFRKEITGMQFAVCLLTIKPQHSKLLPDHDISTHQSHHHHYPSFWIPADSEILARPIISCLATKILDSWQAFQDSWFQFRKSQRAH